MSASNNSPPKFNFELNPNFHNQLAQAYLFMPEQAKTILILFKMLIDRLLGVWTILLEVMLRNRWGTRSLSLYLALFPCWLTTPCLATKNLPLIIYMFLVSGLSLWHYFEARRREFTRAPYRNSYSWGEPIFWIMVAPKLIRLGVPRAWFRDDRIFRFWDPAAGLIFGVLLMVFPPTRILGGVLMLLGQLLLYKRHIIYMRFVDLERDRCDAMDVGQQLTQHNEPTTPQQSYLVQVAAFSLPSQEAEQSMQHQQSQPDESIAEESEPSLTFELKTPPPVQCPNCTRQLKVKAELRGKRVRCTNCHHPLTIPA